MIAKPSLEDLGDAKSTAQKIMTTLGSGSEVVQHAREQFGNDLASMPGFFDDPSAPPAGVEGLKNRAYGEIACIFAVASFRDTRHAIRRRGQLLARAADGRLASLSRVWLKTS